VEGQHNLVAVAGNESLEWVPADDEADRRLHGGQQVLGRGPRIKLSEVDCVNLLRTIRSTDAFLILR
jgi:hypothetical protein